MKIARFFMLSIICGFASNIVLSQTGIPPGTPGAPVQADLIKEKMRQDNMEIERRKPLDQVQGSIGLDNASRKELESLRRVNDEDRQRFEKFLQAENTGIFKLFPNNDCMQRLLIRVDGDCAGFVPESSRYTFRTGTYGGGDIVFFKNSFSSQGLFSQSIMVAVGDIAIEDVSESHLAVKHLIDFRPQLTPAGAERSVKIFSKGVDADGYRFASSLSSSVGSTYAVRKIEFKRGGKNVTYRIISGYPKSLESALRFQERKDMIYVFRVVRQDENGVLTLLWKQISRKDGPTMIFQKGDKYPNLGKE